MREILLNLLSNNYIMKLFTEFVYRVWGFHNNYLKFKFTNEKFRACIILHLI